MPLSTEERKLISRAIHRDREAFAELYVQYHPAVLHRLLALVGNRQEADDLTSETFLRAWNAIHRFEDRGVSIQAWLFIIAQRLAVTYLVRRRRNVALDHVLLEVNPDDSPEQVAERAAEFAAVRRAMLALPHLQREVLVKRFLENLSYDEVVAGVGKPIGTVRVIQHRALRALRRLLLKDRLPQVRQPRATGAGE